ncbi:MAG: glucuronate isomerase [Phycisphaerae bacterium]|nr:glucuronate isomerase [Phycisphaerae bacterium]
MSFLNDNFLLDTTSAQKLYHDYAADMPIIDYHCHLPPAEIANDIRFDNISDIWLAGDHYKWRLMRANGCSEDLCSGDAPAREKFNAYARTIPLAIGNPIYHWSHMELRSLGVTETLNPENADTIWKKTSDLFQNSDISARTLIKKFNVKALCTTDDPIDSLEYHQQIASAKDFHTIVLPTFRPDKARNLYDSVAFNEYCDKLVSVINCEIETYDDMIAALTARHKFFHGHGCRLSDHGLSTLVAADAPISDVRAIFTKVRSGQNVSTADADKVSWAMLKEFAKLDAAAGWVQQIHFGARRNTSTINFKNIGPDAGFDAINQDPCADALFKLFDQLQQTDTLPKTILYNLNPCDTEVLAVLAGCFPQANVPGKMQYGSAWWFLDNIDGMRKQLAALANMSLLGRFVGMLTDSRSLLSYPRHAYFRRILCGFLGDQIDKGLLPNDMDHIGSIVKNISYNNAVEYFDFDLLKQ